MSRFENVVLIAVFGWCGLYGSIAAAQTVATQPISPVPASCTFSKPARVVTALRDIPEVLAKLKQRKIELADAGERFVPFDVVDSESEGLPHRQFVRAYVFADQTIIWYYHGGIGTHFHVVQFYVRRKTGELLFRGPSLGGPLCKTTQALLDGVYGQQDL